MDSSESLREPERDDHKEYLGDGVYASYDGYHVWLSLDAQNPVHRIALEPSVFAALMHYHKRLLDALPKAGPR